MIVYNKYKIFQRILGLNFDFDILGVYQGFPNRRRRGLVDDIGKVSKWLFGTLDSDDGKRFDQTLQILEKNQLLISDQASASLPMVKNFNETIEKIQNSIQGSIQNNFYNFSISLTKKNLVLILSFTWPIDPEATVPKKWTPYKDEKYLEIFPVMKTYEDAENLCRDRFSADLASVDSRDKQIFLERFMKPKNTSNNV